jgi:pyrophosphate--fructose-6-phosphate 1-phosphotransferase
MPSNFDCDLGFALGHGAAALVAAGKTGYMASAHCLASPTAEWRVCGVPLYSMMGATRRAGEAIAAVRTHPVDLHGLCFGRFAAMREALKEQDLYCNPGPLQFAGALGHTLTHRLNMEWRERAAQLQELAAILGGISDACWPGCSADVLSTALVSLRALQQNIQVLRTKEMYSAARTPKHTVVQEQAEQTALRDN